MRKIVLPLLASLALASPALANETRVEARGGVIWSNGTSEDTWGAAVGYDFDLGQTAFAGVELSGDKIGADGTKVAFGASGRLGIKAGTGTALYGTGGYTTETCDACEGQWHLGAGVEQKISGPFYVKAEYRHHFKNDVVASSNTVLGGVGLKF